MYGSQYDRAGQVSRDALEAAEASGDPQALLDALRARQLACSGPEGVAERTRLAQRMLETAGTLGSAWAEMWGRLWRIDTLFETGQLRAVQRELADLDICLDRVPGPIGRWHSLHCAATIAAATARFTEAMRLGAESFAVFSDMGHPIAFGAYSVILGQVGMHIGFARSGLIELFSHLPDQFKPEAADTTRGVATVFPALTQALICLEQGDRAGLRPRRPGPVLDPDPGAAAVLLGARAAGRHRPRRTPGHRVPGRAVRAVPRPARRERRRGRRLPGPGRAAARPRGGRPGPPGCRGAGSASRGFDLRPQRRARLRRARPRRAGHHFCRTPVPG